MPRSPRAPWQRRAPVSQRRDLARPWPLWPVSMKKGVGGACRAGLEGLWRWKIVRGQPQCPLRCHPRFLPRTQREYWLSLGPEAQERFLGGTRASLESGKVSWAHRREVGGGAVRSGLRVRGEGDSGWGEGSQAPHRLAGLGNGQQLYPGWSSKSQKESADPRPGPESPGTGSPCRGCRTSPAGCAESRKGF